jgi:sugar phosphate permease
MALAELSPRLRKTRRWMLLMLVITGIISYFDRSTLAIGNQAIRADLGLSIAQMGVLLSAFSWSYAFCQLPVGGLVDRVGPRRLLGFGALLWSVAQLASGFVTSAVQFAFARAVLGIGESPQYPTCTRVVSQWYTLRQRGTPTGIWNSASPLATAIAPVVLTTLMLSVGWRGMFALMGVAGVAMAIVWLIFYRDPQGYGASPGELAHIHVDDQTLSAPVTLRSWLTLFRFRSTWAMVMGSFCIISVNTFFVTWLPAYLEIQHHLTTLRTGFYASVPPLGGYVGGMLGGLVADRLAKAGISPLNSRKIPLTVGTLGTATCIILASQATSAEYAVALLTGASFFGLIAGTSVWALVSVVAPPGYSASIAGIQNFGGFLGAAILPIVTGLIVQRTGSFTLALLLNGSSAICAALIYGFAVRGPIDAARFDQLVSASA